jgi:DNA-binding GntR family transcriptional regulator
VTGADSVEERRPSLVDAAEQALRDWLTPGRYRPGDRLPPEHQLSAMLGVSRGTLRTALERLEESGEIVRRQGSGTYVGRLHAPTAFAEGLERLVSYSTLAKRRGVELTVRDLTVERRRVGPDIGDALGLDPETAAVTITRVVLADGDAVGLMRDVVHPDVPLPSDARVRRAIERGDMVLDVLLAQDVRVAFSRTRVMPRLLTPRDRVGQALGVHQITAGLEMEEVFHITFNEAVQYSSDIFAPDGIDLQVLRGLEAVPPPGPIVARGPEISPIQRGGGS